MVTMTRYYIQPTGHANGHEVGLILNEDGSVYNGGMDKPKDKKYQFDVPLMAYDNVDIRPRGDAHEQTIDMLLTQQKDASIEVVAAFRFHSAQQIEGFITELRTKMTGFRGKKNHDQQFDFETNRNKRSEQF